MLTPTLLANFLNYIWYRFMYGTLGTAVHGKKARLRWYGHVIRKDEGELVRDIME
jgi:hypothetical protein